MLRLLGSRLPLLCALVCLLGATSLRADGSAPTPANPFGRRFLRSIEFIDYPDILVAVVVGNDQPWHRYDEGERYAGRATSLEARWDAGIKEPLSGSISDQLVRLHQIFMEDTDPGFRETPIDDAGGDIDRGVGGPGGFDRLTALEAQALQANPLLTVETKADANPPDPTVPTVLARYRYPSAGTYHKFSDRLSPTLLAALQAAEAAGDLKYDVYHPETVSKNFRALNQRILHELLDRAYDPSATPGTNYQAMIAVHPFDDYNGRTLRLWYRRAAGRPMFLRDFYCDLYCSADRFTGALSKGDGLYDLITSGLVHEEQAHAANPHFYDVPELFEAAYGSAVAPADSGKFVSQSKAFFSRVDIKQDIDHKLFNQIYRAFQGFVDGNGLLSFLFREVSPWAVSPLSS